MSSELCTPERWQDTGDDDWPPTMTHSPAGVEIEYESIPASLLTQLNCSWCLWYTNGNQKTAETFGSCLIRVGIFSTAEAFWALYSHCIRPSQLSKGTEYHLFRDGITPMWEDPANSGGGTLLLRLRRPYLDYFWEALIVAMIGEQLEDDVCGAVAGRRQDDYIAVWNSKYTKDAHKRLKTNVLKVLKLPDDSCTTYRSHSGSLKFSHLNESA